MKKILLIAVLMFVIGLLHAQKAEFYTKNLDAYVGTWQYATATDTFRIVLKKGEHYNSDGTLRKEIVYGGHLYIKNGKKIADNLSKVPLPISNNDEMTISADNASLRENKVDPNVLRLGFKDRAKDKYGLGKLYLLPGNPAQLHWKIERAAEQVFIYTTDEPEPRMQPGWSVPSDVVLKKVK